MKFLRTPDERFEHLDGYPYAPHYVDVRCDDDATPLRMHYVDEGPRDAKPVLLLHGEPTWSYLYRGVIDDLVARGFRAIAPDLIGFGRSDKPSERNDYTYARHVAWLRAYVEAIDLRDTAIFVQDWGGLLGLRLVAEHGERISHVIAANTFLPTGDERPNEAFARWRAFSQNVPELMCGELIARTCLTRPTDAVVAAYDAPFPDETYKAGARQFPMLVPTEPDNAASEANRRAWTVLERWEKPFLTAFSDSDPITRGGDRAFQTRIPGTRGLPHVTIEGAGHFLQEERPAHVAEAIARALQS
jgi:haloalkane dehalogenase